MVAQEAHLLLQLTRAAQPDLIWAGHFRDAVAALVAGDAAAIAVHQLVHIVVHVAVAHTAAIAGPAHLRMHTITQNTGM